MKKLVFISFTIITLYSCEKQPFDHRLKYVGNYDFTSTNVNRIACVDSSYFGCEVTSFGSFKGEVRISSGDDNGLFIETPNTSYFVRLYKSGSFKSEGDYSGIQGNFNEYGEVYYYFFSHGMMSWTYSYSVEGKKTQ
ncbi:MAG: hypothetical protein COX70_10155 [Flavobacteriales bacterium CG_4_10_14_0_2_um_filter_32_8]|nr:MAG: hypothetical protein COX70_10155 [Flavobacteriales bacterium CG_4_10_14_0_2_um_filter_32_8]